MARHGIGSAPARSGPLGSPNGSGKACLSGAIGCRADRLGLVACCSANRRAGYERLFV